jgi:pyridoxamine 5'-phosphate oxidase
MREGDFAKDPLEQFRRWFGEAQVAGLELPEAMTLATAAADGSPSARTVLLKGVDERGFLFFTNYESRKGRELVENPRASLVFH